MALSGADTQRKTTLFRSETVSGGNAATQKLDAAEDREILAVDIVSQSIGNNENVNAHVEAWTGNDPFEVAGTVRDTEQLVMRAGATQEHDTTNGVGLGLDGGLGYRNFEENPFPWDRHVTLSVRVQNSSSDAVGFFVIVHYREV